MYTRRHSLRHDWKRMPSHLKLTIGGIALCSTVFVVKHIEEIPATGRKRLMFLSYATEEALGNQAYQEIIRTENVLPSTHPMTKAVRRIGKQIEQQSIIKETNKPLFQWKFDVVLSPIPNAFCLPGGKIIVYSGLFDQLKNENELAAVLFHEAAHGIARHGAEKISFSLFIYGLIAFFFPDAGQLSDLFVKLAVDLPFSRKLETEADQMGLKMMANACYDPRASIHMNEQMGKLNKNERMKYLSTHPPTKERIQHLHQHLNEAMEIYQIHCHQIQNEFFQIISHDNR